MRKALVALSGGMDSATLLAKAVYDRVNPKAVSFVYPSKHNKWEVAAASRVAIFYSVPFITLDLENLFSRFKSALLTTQDTKVPEGHYNEESMKQTVVPFRNGIFLSALAGFAESEGLGELWIGAHAGDHHIYPDCRPSFLDAMSEAIFLGTDRKVELHSPFQNMTKEDILKNGVELKVPYQMTRTCYKDQKVACGRCGSCQERLEAFSLLGIADPIEYETRELLPKAGV